MSATQAKYERLLQDLRADLRPQRAWGEGRGIFMVLGHFVVGIAAGAWLFSLYYESRAGLAHLVNLARPKRFWRMVTQLGTSWISRGFLGLSFFLAGAFLYLVPQFVPGAPWGNDSLLAGLGYRV